MSIEPTLLASSTKRIKIPALPPLFVPTSKKDFAPNYFQLFSAEADPKEAGDKISDIFFGRHFI